MAATHGLGTYGNGVGTVTPEDHKLALAGLVTKTTTGAVRAGVFWGGNPTLVTGKANMSYDVAAFNAVTTRGASDGAILLGNDGVVNVTTTAAPGSNSRYDVVYLWQREYALDGTDSEPVIAVAQGTATSSPTAPSLAAFPGAIELARILVPAGVSATNTGTTITQTAPFTAAAGGAITFRTVAEMEATTGLPENTPAWVLADNEGYVNDGTGWLASPRPGQPGIPFRMAAGTLVGTGGFDTVPLPGGRFSQPPIITASVITGAGGAIGATILITGVSASSFQIRTTGAFPLSWHAIQMTASASAG